MNAPKLDILSVFGNGGEMARRRGQRKGYLFRKGPSWFVRYRVDTPERDENGKMVRAEITKFVASADGPDKVGKREAQRIAWDEYLSKLDQSATRPQSMRTVKEFVAAHFEPEHVWSLTSGGKAFYDNMLRNHVLPEMGDVRMRDVSSALVQAVVKDAIARGKSVQTATHIKYVISAIFRRAKTLGWYIGELPTEGVRLPRMVRKERGALTWSQVVAIAAKLPEAVLPARSLGAKRDAQHRQLLEQCTVLFFLLALSGLRIGEALGLQWMHLNATDAPVPLGAVMIPEHCLLVIRSYSRKPKRFRNGPDDAGRTKSEAGRRLIPVPRWLESMILRLRARGSFTSPEDPIFVARTGKPLNAGNIQKRVLKQAAALAGMGTVETDKAPAKSWVSFHWFRHTASTLLQYGGATTKERQELIGHASEAMQLHYTHGDMDRMRLVMERAVDPRLAQAVFADLGKDEPIQ